MVPSENKIYLAHRDDVNFFHVVDVVQELLESSVDVGCG